MILHFIAGLPRSGSTLLANCLAQNPRFYATQTSGMLEVLFGVRNSWDKIVEMRAMENGLSETRKMAVLRGIANDFYADVDKPIVFDKSRGWLAHLEMIENILQRPAKVLVPVRDLRDVLASFEKLWREASKTRQLDIESGNYANFQTVEQRLFAWTNAEQPVGLAYNRIKDALQRGYRDRMHFVEYDKFCNQPSATTKGIYEFLDEPIYEHDFTHVEQVTWEDDTVHGFPAGSLHNIRSKIIPQPTQWPTILGSAAEKYRGMELW
jgi:sulfotransferase